MRCEDARPLIDLTVGGGIAPADVGVSDADARALRVHLRLCAACRAEQETLRETAHLLTVALVDTSSQRRGDESLADAVLARLPDQPPGMAAASAAEPVSTVAPILRLPPALQRVAAVLIAAIGCAAAWQVAAEAPNTRRGGVAPLPAGMGADIADASDDEPRGPPVPGRIEGYAGPRMTDVASALGIDAVDHTGHATEKDWMVETVGHGAAVFDLDGDGDLDIFVPDGNRFDPSQRVAGTWRLYRNDGPRGFADITAGSGLEGDDWACGVVAGDIDADGRPDLFVPCFGANHLFRNLGDGRFEDITVAAGVAGLDVEWSSAAALGDVDGDGDLDLYVANYADMRAFMEQAPGGRGCSWRDMPVVCGPMPLPPQQDRLYVNQGNGRFEDATEARLPRGRRYSFQPVMADMNGDGAPDIFVASDAHQNLFLLNDGTGRFSDEALSARVAANGEGREQACMGVTTGDFDGDGAFDLFVTNFSHEPNVLYRSRGARGGVPEFSDATKASRSFDAGFYTLGWGVTFLDYDSDGDLDAAVANGHIYPGVEEVVASTSYAQHLSLLRNDGTGRFQEVTASAGDDLGRRRVHRGLAVADFNDDGHPDLLATVLNGAALLIENDGRGAGRSVQLWLRLRSGVEAAGARVRASVRDGDEVTDRWRQLVLGSSFACSEDPRVHVGLGGTGELETVEVHWPFGETETFGPFEAGGIYELTQGRAEIRRVK